MANSGNVSTQVEYFLVLSTDFTSFLILLLILKHIISFQHIPQHVLISLDAIIPLPLQHRTPRDIIAGDPSINRRFVKLPLCDRMLLKYEQKKKKKVQHITVSAN